MGEQMPHVSVDRRKALVGVRISHDDVAGV